MADAAAGKRRILNRVGTKIVLLQLRHRAKRSVDKQNIEFLLKNSKAMDLFAERVQKSYEADHKGGPVVDALAALVRYVLENPEKVLALIAGIIKLFV